MLHVNYASINKNYKIKNKLQFQRIWLLLQVTINPHPVINGRNQVFVNEGRLGSSTEGRILQSDQMTLPLALT